MVGTIIILSILLVITNLAWWFRVRVLEDTLDDVLKMYMEKMNTAIVEMMK